MPDGWHYPQLYNGVTTIIRGESYTELLTEVTSFRDQNGIPLDTVQKDVDEYICYTYPRQCYRKALSRSSETVLPSLQAVRFIDELTTWALSVARDEHREFVLPTVAERRADICRNCPFNRPWQTSTCAGCTANANRIFMNARKGKDVAFGKDLYGCSLHKFDVRAAVWLRDPAKRAKMSPETCWVGVLNND